MIKHELVSALLLSPSPSTLPKVCLTLEMSDLLELFLRDAAVLLFVQERQG